LGKVPTVTDQDETLMKNYPNSKTGLFTEIELNKALSKITNGKSTG